MALSDVETITQLVNQVKTDILGTVQNLAESNTAEHKVINDRLDGVNTRQDKINGGIAVLRWLIPLLLAAVAILAQRLG